jgi:hypothetical protein
MPIRPEEMESTELLLKPDVIAALSQTIRDSHVGTMALAAAQAELDARIALAHAMTAKEESLVVTEQLAVLRASTAASESLGARLFWANVALVAMTAALVAATIMLAVVTAHHR